MSDKQAGVPASLTAYDDARERTTPMTSRDEALTAGLDVDRLREAMVEVMEQRGLGGGGLQPIDAVAIAKVYGGPIWVASTTGLDAAIETDLEYLAEDAGTSLTDRDREFIAAATRSLLARLPDALDAHHHGIGHCVGVCAHDIAARLATPQEKPAVAERETT